MNFEEYNILGNIVDDTFKARDVAGSFKIIAKIVSENKMQVTCMTVVNLLDRHHMQEESKKALDQLNKSCNEFIKETKKQFKDHAGRALKCKEVGSVDLTTELLNMSAYSPKGMSLIRAVYNFEVK